MKKLLLCLAVCIGLCLPASAADVSVGVAWIGQSSMADRVIGGFDEAMTKLAPDADIEYKKELADAQELADLVARWEKEKDAMVILRSNGAKWLGTHKPAIPAFIGACNHPVILGAVDDMAKPDGNVTGVTYFLPKSAQFEVFAAICPRLDSALLVVEKGHAATPIDVAETEKVCAERGIDLKVVECATMDDATGAVKASTADVVIIGAQALLLDHAKAIVDAAGNTPVLAYASRPVEVGALGGFVADDHKLGTMLAESVVQVTVENQPVAGVPVKVDPDPLFYVNSAAAQRLGVQIPYHILESARIVQ